jgi:hypothetical protein
MWKRRTFCVSGESTSIASGPRKRAQRSSSPASLLTSYRIQHTTITLSVPDWVLCPYDSVVACFRGVIVSCPYGTPCLSFTIVSCTVCMPIAEGAKSCVVSGDLSRVTAPRFRVVARGGGWMPGSFRLLLGDDVVGWALYVLSELLRVTAPVFRVVTRGGGWMSG